MNIAIEQDKEINNVVKQAGFRDKTSFLKFTIELGLNYVNRGMKLQDDPKKAQEFLNEQLPKICHLNETEAFTTWYRHSPKEMRDAIFLKIDEERKKILRSEKKEKERGERNRICGFELEPKIGYWKGPNDRYVAYAPILPSDDEWEFLTEEQKNDLFKDQQQKLEENISRGIPEERLYPLKDNYREIAEALEKTVKKNDSFFKSS
jgi:hypothetical protein